jgi:hypothetical protein
MAKKTDPPKAKDRPTSIRLSESLYTALDKARAQIKAQRPGEKVDRAATVRVLLGEALTARNISVT